MPARFTPDGGTSAGTPHGGPYSLEIKDSPGLLNAIVQETENETLTDVGQSNLTTSQTETQTLSEGAPSIGVVAADVLPAQTGTDSFAIVATESNGAIADVAQSVLTDTQAESATLAEGTPTFRILPAADTGTLTDARDTFQYYFITSASDNDSSKTTPANAQGKNDGVFAKVTCGLGGATDTTNPCTLTGLIGNVPSTGSYTSKKIYLWFTIAAGSAALDTLTISVGAGGGFFANIYGTGAANSATAAAFETAPLVFDVSSQTMANLSTTLTITVSYKASVVLSPSTSIMFDAAALVLEGGF